MGRNCTLVIFPVVTVKSPFMPRVWVEIENNMAQTSNSVFVSLRREGAGRDPLALGMEIMKNSRFLNMAQVETGYGDRAPKIGALLLFIRGG